MAGDLEMTISTTGFELSEALLGKPNVGHKDAGMSGTITVTG